MKDLYLILQVTRTATPEQIHSAYRRRALELHPDKSGAGSEPFIELQKAYAVLSDPGQRAAYDSRTEGSPVRRRGARTQRGAEPLRQARPADDLREIWLARSVDNAEPSLADVLKHLGRKVDFLTPLQPEPAECLTVEVFLSDEEALAGGTVRILIPATSLCHRCRGRGRIGRRQCWRCSGSGLITVEYPVDVVHPPDLCSEHLVQVRLDEFGIRNLLLTVLFRTEAYPHKPAQRK